jgi:exonuclease SbcC
VRPLRLRLQAFGAFAGEVVLDLERLGPSALFLVHGPTGAGKTTLLDALTWALFGKGSTGERDLVRSDHAAEDRPTEVELVFDYGGARYRLLRRAAFERAKRRGDGTTRQPGAAELWRLDEAGHDAVLLGDRYDRVTEATEALIGLGIDEFRQVAVLPQGQFRRLLAASSDERETILAVLFGTDRLERLQAFLRERASADREALEDCLRRRTELLVQAGLADEAALAAAREALQAARAELVQRLATERQAASAAAAAWRAGEDAAARLAEHESAARALAEVEAERPALDALRAEAEAARRALHVEPLRRAVIDAQARLDAQEDQASAAHAALAMAERASAGAQAALAAEQARAPEREAALAERSRLEAIAQRVETWGPLLDRRDAAAAGLVAAEAALTAAQADLAAAEAQSRAAEAALDAARAAQAELPAAEVALAALDKAARARGRLSVLRQQLVSVDRRLAEATTAQTQAAAAAAACREALNRIEAAWRDAQAGRLAATLVDGEPCPVCGALHHPAPAAIGSRVDDAALAAARDALEAAERDAAAVREQVSAQARARDSVSSEIAKETIEAGAWAEGDGAALNEALMELRSRVTDLAGQAATLGEATIRATAAGERLARARRALEDALGSRAVREREHAVAVTELAGVAADLPEAWRVLDGPGLRATVTRTLQQADARLRGLDAALEDARDALAQATARRAAAEAAARAADAALGTIRGELEAAERAWHDAARAAGFADGAAAHSAGRPPDAMQAIGQRIAALEQRLAAAADRAERAARAAAGIVAPDLEALRAAADSAARQVESSAQALGGLEARAVELAGLSDRLAALGIERAERERRHALTGGLADLAEGKGLARKITFQRFVLGALLDEVLEAASLRLVRMTRGRYLLHRRRDLETGHRGRTAGLDLDVEDAWTGRSRPVGSLSGGESFMAALSLALGLSDVVQRRAGGRRIDALFVDEGFGTLDPEALELALQALTDLRAEGRIVGIISHVPELKERIDVRLEVSRGERGSSARLVLP